MRPQDGQYFSEFLAEFQRETDRGAALVGAALIDSRLERLLSSHLIESKAATELLGAGDAPLGSLSSRIKISFALGLITELEYQEADLIRKVRNEFAHEVHGLTFSSQRISGLCSSLNANTPDGERFDGNPRQLFINSVVLLSLSLWYRPEHAAPYKAVARSWEWQLSPDRRNERPRSS
jgi:mannitol operon repressor